jgi:hypothetical protein
MSKAFRWRWPLIVTLLIAVLVSPVSAQPTPTAAFRPDAVSLIDAHPALTRPSSVRQSVEEAHLLFEGGVQAHTGDKWVVAGVSLFADEQTVLLEGQGAAEPGAWVTVWATQLTAGAIHADQIRVERASDQQGPPTQFAGELEKQYGDYWVVAGTLFYAPLANQPANKPAPGALLRVVADQGNALQAVSIEQIADSPERVPAEFVGTVESQSPGVWVVNGQPLQVVVSDTVILGAPAVGDQVEVQAVRAGDGWLARLINQRAPVSQTAGTRGMLSATAGPPVVRSATGHNDPDESALLSTPTAIATQLAHAARPALAFTPDGAAHAVWESSGMLMYAARQSDGVWGPAIRVAMGTSPALAADQRGVLHLLFSNQFLGNDEIYYVTFSAGEWSLPVNISHTSGRSYLPSLTIGADGRLHATWMDDTPGYWTIYHGAWGGVFWSSQPVPSGRGENPSIAAAADGAVYVTWQDQAVYGPGGSLSYGVFLSELSTAGNWSLPVDVSDHPGTDAIQPSVTAADDGLAHLVWVEQGSQVLYAYGRRTAWSVPAVVINTMGVTGPRLVTEYGRVLYLAWSDGDSVRVSAARLRSDEWSAPAQVQDQGASLRDIALTVAPAGGVVVSWVRAAASGDMAVYESERASVFVRRSWLPLIWRETGG